jgi:thiol-disulfide isomerase/thioredoxin
MVYLEAKSEKEVYDLLKNNKRVVLKFGADFCPQCRKIKDFVKSEASECKKLLVVAIDTADKSMDGLCKAYKIEDIPNFIPVYKGNRQGEGYQGSNVEKIKWMVFQMDEMTSNSKLSAKPPSSHKSRNIKKSSAKGDNNKKATANVKKNK